MKNNIIRLTVLTMLMASVLVFIIPNKVYANSSFSIQNIINSTKTFTDKGASAGGTAEMGEIVNEIQPLINTLYWVGVAVVIGAAMFLGVQYFNATGDPKGRAEIQKKLIGFIVSAVVLFAAYPIWSFLVSFFTSLI